MRLTVTHAAYGRTDGHPYLALTLALLGPGGSPRVARVDWEQKPTTVAAGWIFLGDEFEAILPAGSIAVPAPAAPGGFTLQALRGFTRDPVVGALYARFLADVDSGAFAPGLALTVPEVS